MTMTAKEKLAEWDEADRLKASILEKEIEAVKGLISLKIKTAKRGDSIGGEIGLSQNFRDSFNEPVKAALVEYYKNLGWDLVRCKFAQIDKTLYWEIKMSD